jgi:uncharacterized membrane protein
MAPTPTILATFPAVAIVVASKSFWLCSAGVALFVVGILSTKSDFAQARGLDKITVLANLCFALPLAVFGAEHFTDTKSISQMVPSYIPWHLFWAYFVGIALLSASLSIATKIQVQWSGLLFGIMMFSFDSMMALPGTIADPHNRFNWVLLLREPSFGCGAWALSTTVANGWGPRVKAILITIARVVIGVGAVFYSVEHFLHPENVPGVPLEKLLPAWIPAHTLISSLTGAILLAGGVLILLAKSARRAATYLGGWLVLIVVLVYGPILIASLLDPSVDVQVEGINYFFDTLLYAGAVLALAKASPRTD